VITDFNYWLTGVGWAEAFFSNKVLNLRFEFSYLSDPLSELIEALIRLICDESEKETIPFLDEPGQHILTIKKHGNEFINIKVFWTNVWNNFEQETETVGEQTIVYSDSDTIKNFTSVVCNGIDGLLQRHTPSEYFNEWHLYPFPLEAFEKLRLLVSQL
jgi:hypothetical protein